MQKGSNFRACEKVVVEEFLEGGEVNEDDVFVFYGEIFT